MNPISNAQIEFMLEDIAKQGIHDEDLRNNILDHVCCLIENSPEPIEDFELCYRFYIKKFYQNHLREIEVETNLLITFKHYYQMKKFMLLSGIAGAGILILGNLFKFMHWPGAALFTVLGIGVLSLFFIPLIFFIKIKENPKNSERALLAIGTLLTIAFSFSVLFKMMHWPYANILGNISLLGAVLVFSPMYLVNSFKTKDKQTNAIIAVILIVAAAGMLYSLVAIRPMQSIQHGSWMVVENNAKSNKDFEEYCLLQIGSDSNENAKIKREKFFGLNQKAIALRNHLYQKITGNEGEIKFAELYEINPNDLVMSNLLPTDNTQVEELIAFEEALNRVYGNSEKNIDWAKTNLFAVRNSEIFIRINDIEKDALLHLLRANQPVSN